MKGTGVKGSGVKGSGVFERNYGATHPSMMDGASIAMLRARYLVPDLFRTGELVLVHAQDERFVIGGAVPADGVLTLPVQTEPPSAAGAPFLVRRELGVVNVGMGEGVVEVDGVATTLDRHEALYVPMGSQAVRFTGTDARFYLISVPAHVALPLHKVTLAESSPMQRGSEETANRRTVHPLILPGTCRSAALCLGLTRLEPGSVWNTMPPHVHERRSEVYLYLDLAEDERVFHFMGRPDALRHLVVRNEEAVISPPWSVHMGCGTRAYSFIWAMAGENLDYDDMDVCTVADLA